jgi:First Longin domain of INTU, CCZ1 and HPS4
MSSDPTISSFYIYNSTTSPDESSPFDILYHYPPPSPPITSQLRAVGLALGILEFSRAFSPNSPVQEIQTEKSLLVPVEVEQGWWVLAV